MLRCVRVDDRLRCLSRIVSKQQQIEVAAADPNLGTVFYTVEQDPARRGAFTRQTS